MKRTFIIGIIICFVGSFFSCSMTFEKRRYRPGYHVDMVKVNHRANEANGKHSASLVNKSNLKPVIIESEINSSKPNLLSINQASKRDSNHKINSKQGSNPKFIPKKKFDLSSFFQSKKILKTNSTHGASKLGIILGWTLGGTAIILAIAALIVMFKFGIYGIIIGVSLMIVAAILGILAFVLGFKQYKEPSETKPVSKGFINGSFIFSIIVLILSIISFVFSFFIYPFGLVSMIISITTMVAAVIAFSLGFRALKDDKSIKTKLIIIFGFIALLIAALALILLFI